ncbi:mitochondrial calcium uniporter regulator 1 [Corythoichthys intestinalis]|uniref:mitochondrial calcium uniporter regulator 1 n=1 Tax=Corythoichthys intestinalis TaxID=161448 RepID=UPI0025A4DFDF|nr:mitochondrial calcium uniporter regulator 1 [Corythoichthys intestinalis]
MFPTISKAEVSKLSEQFYYHAFTMVLKHSHTQLKVFARRQYENRFLVAQETGGARHSKRLFYNYSPNELSWTHYKSSASFVSSSSDIARAKRQAGLRHIHLSGRDKSSLSPTQQDVQPDIPKVRKLFFDTHAVVRLLEENGFTTHQAEALVKVLLKMTNSNMDTIYSDMVTKVQQEIMMQRVMSQIAALKKDMIILEKSEFSTLLAENEKLKIQLLQLKVQLSDVMNKIRSDTFLDMNLEKSRVKELKADHERKLLETRSEILEMTAEQDRHLTQTNMKIDTEVAGLKTMLESHKLDSIKYLAGSIFTCLTVVLGFYRIWM